MHSQKRSIRVMVIVTCRAAPRRIPTAPPWAMSLRPPRTYSAPAPVVERHSSA